jgi:hypothetical protein
MGILVHGCVGEPMVWSCGSVNEPNIDTVDVLTTKYSTLLYDDVTMQKMIELVQKAKGTSLYNKGDNH